MREGNAIVGVAIIALMVGAGLVVVPVLMGRRDDTPPPRVSSVPEGCEDLRVVAPDGGYHVVVHGTCRPCMRGCFDIVSGRAADRGGTAAELLERCFAACEATGAGNLMLRVSVDAAPKEAP